MSSALAYADKHRLPELAHEALPVLNEGSRDYWVARSIDCLLYVQEDGYPIRQYIRKKVRLPGEM
ncbi:MAG: hypothetical protein FJZ58_01925, partial [Chlamydiae bacterium]|nr:hypothetical protein [Chlamydiota bacterium]